MKTLGQRATSLPLGIDIGSQLVSVVACDCAGDRFDVRETATLEVPPADGNVDLAIAQTIRLVVSRMVTRERRCILAAPAGEVVTRSFRVPPGMRRGEAERAAALEADTFVDWPSSERLVALDDIPGKSDEKLLSIARNGTVERLVAIARAAGIKPVAVDLAACAWRRALPHADAVLDLAGDRAELIVFAEPAGVTHLFPPRLVDDRLASGIRAAFAEARRDGVADVRTLAISSNRFRYESIEELLRDDGYAITPVTLGGLEAPPWALAYGLASWSVALRGLRAS